MKLLDNNANELSKITEELNNIIQSGTVDVQTFSSNCVSNMT